MNTTTRVKLAMALRVRDLLIANPFGYQPGDEVAAQLAKKVGRAEGLKGLRALKGLKGLSE